MAGIRGERIGTAYVRILADGSGLSDSIRDELDGANSEEVMRAQGRTDSEAYQEGHEDQMDRFGKKFVDGLIAGVRRNSGRLNAADEQMSKDWFKDLEKQIKYRFPEVGAQMVQNLREGFIKSGGDDQFLEGFVERIEREALRADDQFNALLKKRSAEMAEAYRLNEKFNLDAHRDMLNEAHQMDRDYTLKWSQTLRDAYRENRAFDKQRLDDMREAYQMNRDFDLRRMATLREAYQMDKDFNLKRMELLREAYKMNQVFDAKTRKSLQDRLMLERAYAENQRRNLKGLREDYKDLLDVVRRLQAGEKNLGVSSFDVNRRVEQLRIQLEKMGGDRSFSRELDRINVRLGSSHNRMHLFAKGLDDVADAMGVISGRGSRNNFLNFIGSMTRNFAKLAFLAPKIALTLGGKMVTAFNDAGRGVEGLLAASGQLLISLGSLGLALTGVAIGAAALFAIMSPLVSLFSALLGIVAALAASISFALIAAFAALAAVALPAVAAIAVALGGILSMSDKMKKKFSDAFEPVKDEFIELGDVVAEVFTKGLTDQADRFADILKTLEPLTRKVAEAIVDMGNGWLEMMEGRGFRQFIDAMERFLPDAIRRLGDIIGNSLGGLGGILRGMIPFMRDVLRWLDDITTQFNDWANSAKGQNDIKDFFDRAADSLESVWNWLDSVWDLLVTVLSAGKDTGDNLFDSMAENIERFTQFLKDNPDALEDWFDHAQEIAEDIGRIAVSIGQLVDKLDSPEGRAALQDMLGFMDDMAKIVGPVADGISDVTGEIVALQEAGKSTGTSPGSNAEDVTGWTAFLNNPADWAAGGLIDFFRPDGTFNGWLDSLGKKTREIFNIPDPNPPSTSDWWPKFVDNIPSITTETWSRIFNWPGENETKKHAEDYARWVGMVLEGEAIDFFEIIDWSNTEDISKKMRPLVHAIMEPLRGLFFDIMDMFGIPHPEKVADKVRAVDIPGRIQNAIGNNTVDLEKAFNIPDPAAIARHFSQQAQEIMNAIGYKKVDLERAFDIPSPASIADQFISLAEQILGVIGPINLGGLFVMPATVQAPQVVDSNGNPIDTPHGGRIIPGTDAAIATVGPSWTATGGKTINASGWTIVSPTEDAEAVATEVVNQLAAVGY